jgi:alpha-glucosidase
MRLSIPQLINLGLSGYAFAGADIGGFNGSPTPDLLTRWMELGVFNPIYRNHSAKETRFREPWVDGPEHEAIRKRYIETRYRLLPYIYTGLEETTRTGIPLMRPMFLEFPDQPSVNLNDQEFMFGDNMLVAPQVWPFTGQYKATLPAGEWYDFWTGAKVSGGGDIAIEPRLDALPVYVRAGSIIPEQSVVQNTDETPQGPLLLNVYPGPQCRGSLYADDGKTFAYQKNQSLRLNFTCELSPGHIDVELSAPSGTYQPWFHEVQLNFYGIKEKISGVTTDSQPMTGWKVQSGVVTLPPVKWSNVAHHFRVSITQASER